MLDSPFHIRRLQHEIQIRKEKNPRYSLRAFAKYLGLGPSTLSRILSHQQELSPSVCKNIMKKLKFNRDDSILFIASMAEEKKRRAYRELYSLIDDGSQKSVFETYEWMLANTPDLLFVFDSKGRIIYANDPVSQFFNIPTELIIAKNMHEIGMHKNISKKIEPCLRSVFKNPRIEKVEECYEADGDNRCFEVTLVPVGHSENVIAVACHWRDITEKTQCERLWKASIQAGETFAEIKDLSKALSIFTKNITEHFCDACVVHMPDGKSIVSGHEKLITHHDPKSFSLQAIEHSDRMLSVPVRKDEKKNEAIISFIRTKKRKPFEMRDLELARDIQLKVESLFNS